MSVPQDQELSHPTALTLIEPYMMAMSSIHRSFINSTNDQAAYAEALFHTIRYVRETIPTLLRAADCRPEHPASGWLKEHAKEEHDHDKIFEEDLYATGYRTPFPPSEPIEQLVLLEKQICSEADPVSTIFGDMIVMECFPPSADDIVQYATKFGFSARESRGYLLHAEVDAAHRSEITGWLNSGTISTDVVIERALVVCRLFYKHWELMRERYAKITAVTPA
jgi:hypothetical protein